MRRKNSRQYGPPSFTISRPDQHRRCRHRVGSYVRLINASMLRLLITRGAVPGITCQCGNDKVAGLNNVRVSTNATKKLANIARLKGRQRTRRGQRGQEKQRRQRGEAEQRLGRMRALRGTEKVCRRRRISLAVERKTERIQAAQALAECMGH